MLPKASFCLNIPRTGTTFLSFFFNNADYLELKRRIGLNYLTVSSQASLNFVKAVKRYSFEYGNLNCRLSHHHAGYSSFSYELRKHPKICVLRDIKEWYYSYYLYYTHRNNSLLTKVMRLFMDNVDCGLDKEMQLLILKYKQEFIDRCKEEELDIHSIQYLSMKFFIWFNDTIRMRVMMNQWVGMKSLSKKKMGFLTFRSIVILFNDPKKILSMEVNEFDEYLASGKYMRDIKCDFFLDFNNFKDQLCSLMIDELGYTQDIILFLKENIGKINQVPEKKKQQLMQEREIDKNDLFAQVFKDEEVYVKYILPLRLVDDAFHNFK